MQKFYDSILAAFKRVPADPTLDVALLGLPLAEAAHIEATDEIRHIHRAEKQVGRFTRIDFAEISDAFPPLETRNIFVEFHSSSWSYVGPTPLHRAGLHLVPLARAQSSLVFSKLPAPPRELARCAEAYALVAYLERDGGRVDVHSVGLMVGLDEAGHLVSRWPFPIEGHFPLNPAQDEAWQQSMSQIGMLAYLVFSAFMMVNQREARLRQVASRRWVIGEVERDPAPRPTPQIAELPGGFFGSGAPMLVIGEFGKPPFITIVREDGQPVSLTDETLMGGRLAQAIPVPRSDIRQMRKTHGLTGKIGAISAATEDGYKLYFAWFEDNGPLEALRQLEAMAPLRVPPALWMALFVWAKSIKKTPFEISEVTALFSGPLYHLSLNPEPSLRDPQSFGFDEWFSALLEHGALPHWQDVPATDLVQFVWKLGRWLWQPEHQKQIVAYEDEQALPVDTLTAILAFSLGYCLANNFKFIQFVNGQVPLGEPLGLWLWRVVSLLQVFDPPPQVLEYLYAEGVKAANNAPDIAALAVNVDLARGSVLAMVEDATANKRYGASPAGDRYQILLPQGFPLREMGFDYVRIWHEHRAGQEEAVWYGLYGQEHSFCSYWTPDQEFLAEGVGGIGSAAIVLTISAIWRDIVTEGEAVFPVVAETTPPSPPRKRSGRGQKKRKQKKRGKIASALPRRKQDSPNRAWGEAEEYAGITRSWHSVSPHLRRLNPGHQASEKAIRLARLYGFITPKGFTFVQAHYRGAPDDATQGEVEPKTVRCKGLATVTWLLKGTQAGTIVKG